jgi:hypothetical protein
VSDWVDKERCLMCGKDNDIAVGFCGLVCKDEWFDFPKFGEEDE